MHIHPAFAFSPLLALAACISAPIHTQSPDASAILHAQLNAPIVPDEITADNQSLEKVLHYIAENNHLNMVINWPALKAAGIQTTTPVTVNLHNITLATALNIVLSQPSATTPLDFANVEGVLHVSSKTDLAANTSTKYIRKSYDVRDLITGPTLTGTRDSNRRAAYLIDIITSQISPTTWHIIQYPDAARQIGPNTNIATDQAFSPKQADKTDPIANNSITDDAATGEGVIAAFNTSLIISQTPEIQAEIADLLNLLRKN